MPKYLYKLTDEFGDTTNQTHWDKDTKHEIAKGLRDNTKPLCSEHYLHAYEHPLVAVFMNPRHAKFKNPHLWKATGWVQKREGQLKCGCFSLKTIERIPLPVITTAQRIRAAIYCALIQKQSEKFETWATNWLSGKDQTGTAAYAAAYAATSAAAVATSAAYDAASTAASAAYAAAYVAYDAASTADAATAATAASYAAVATASYAAAASYTAVAAADAAVYTNSNPINLIKILKRAIKEENTNALLHQQRR